MKDCLTIGKKSSNVKNEVEEIPKQIDFKEESTSSLESNNSKHNPSYLFAVNLNDSKKRVNNKEQKYLNEISDAEYVLETTDYDDELPTAPIHHIIIDCSPFNYIDSVGIQGLLDVN